MIEFVMGGLLSALTGQAAYAVVESQQATFRTEVVAQGLTQPWDMVFLPEGDALVSDRRTGLLHHLALGTGVLTPVEGVPPLVAMEDAGLQGLALHPEFENNRWLYFTYSAGTPERSTTVVDRGRLKGQTLVEVERIFTANAWSEDRYHYGARILFHDGHLFLTIGDRHHRDRSQMLDNHAGTIVRLNDDGSVPEDNPFVGRENILPEIWSYGHRHSQGLAVQPGSSQLWSHEHGPRGGDELNRIQPGTNYGWPVISWGFEYDGGPIGKGIVAQEGMQQPAWVWSHSIAPSGMLFYTGSLFPRWQGNLFTGSMARVHLNRLVFENGQVIAEERMLNGAAGRVRFVVQGPEGAIYFGNDSGQIVRLLPASTGR